ncbi:MAG: hypothetical protein LBQ11_00325 [Candidatus Nomurabacteria bacterium]|jgi:hypothetical protein|nr:hypothetical protein [Candidatus Nomurabacteria bacterium]
MDKGISVHDKFIQNEIAKLQKKPNREAAASLLSYHDIMTRNFQHERQIHLYVTLFFALLMIGSWVVGISMIMVLGGFDVILWPLGLLMLILTILEGFYIRHYYYLENRTEKLYRLTREIYDLIST